jgi:hypothetical protein
LGGIAESMAETDAFYLICGLRFFSAIGGSLIEFRSTLEVLSVEKI